MPKTRSQGAASPAQEPQTAPPRTRARKPKVDKPKIDLSPVANSSSSTQVEPALPAAASSPIPKSKDVLSAVASPHITKISKASTTKVSHRQLLHSKGMRSTGLTNSRLLRSSQKIEVSIRDRSPSPELNDPPCCVHCHRNPFDLNDVPLVAPKIVYAKTNYKNASTQSSADVQEESGLTVLAAQTPVKRTREESATELQEQPAAKRHQSNDSNATESTTQTSAQTSPPGTSTNTSTKVSKQMSTQTDSGSMTDGQSRSKSAPTTPKRTMMASITQAKSRAKSPRFSPLTRSQVGSMQITSDMTWGQVQLTRTRRAKLREKQIQASQDAEAVDEKSPQPGQSEAAPTIPQTAPQAKTGFFGSLRNALHFVPQLPTSVAQMVTNPFSPARSTSALESKPADSSPVQEPTNGMEYSQFEPPNMHESSPAIEVEMDDGMAPVSAAQEANASPVSAKRKAFGLYYDDPNFILSDDSDEEEFLPPAAKRQKLEKAQTPRSVLKKRSGNDNGTIPRSNKRVTFDDSPVDTPSKVRTRAHEYDGIHFADAPSHSGTSPSSDDETILSNSPATKANTEANTPFYYDPPEIPPLPADYVLPPDFTPTSANPRPGTFCLDFNTYDENDDEIDWDAPIEAIHSNIVGKGPDTPTVVQTTKAALEEPVATPAMALPPATPRIAHAELPATTVALGVINIHTDINAGPASISAKAEANVLADVTQQINRVRSTAEQHKSKSPSRLSQVDNATSSSPPAEDEYNEFDAGWPKPKSYVEAGICSQRVFDIVNKNSDPRDIVIGEMIYEQDLKEWEEAHALEKEQGIPVRYPWVEDEEEQL